jgi:hypothetical protein
MERFAAHVRKNGAMMKRRVSLILSAVALFGAGLLIGQKTFGTPSTVLHVVTVRWTKDSTADQRQAALDGVKTMAAANPAIKNVWTKTLKVQSAGDDYNAVFAIEFASPKALEDYVQDPAHVAWKKIYDPIHDQSTTHDVTN